MVLGGTNGFQLKLQYYRDAAVEKLTFSFEILFLFHSRRNFT